MNNKKDRYMVKLTQTVLIIALLTIVGCDENKTEALLDNSIGEVSINKYGYYGDNVVFGTSKIVGDWILFDKVIDYNVKMIFKVDSNVTETKDYNVNDGNYGVSKDGITLNTNILSEQTQISYLQTYNDYTTVENEDGTKDSLSCLNVDLYISDDEEHKNLIMCPFHSIAMTN